MAEAQNDDTDRTSRCKRMRYRAWHRGTREMDLLLGPFADSINASWPEDMLNAFERMLDRRDDEFHDLIIQNGTLEDSAENNLLQKLRVFHGGAGA